MSIPDYQSLMLPVLSASLDGEIRIGDIVESLAEKLGLTPEERGQLLLSGKQTLFANRVHWAKTYIGKAGLIESTRRGHFKITARGRQVIESKPAHIDNNFLERVPNRQNRKGIPKPAKS
jgi:restriction system protein